MRAILFLTLLLTALGACSQTQPSLPSGTVPYSTNLYRATDGSIWTGKTGSYTNLGNKQYVDSLSSLGYTNEMIDSIALYNYDRARNRANHTGTQAQSTVVNLVSDLASKENISNKVTSLSSPNDTTYPTSKAVSDAINAIPPTEVELGSGLYKDGDGKINLGLDLTTIGTTNKGLLTDNTYLINGDISSDNSTIAFKNPNNLTISSYVSSDDITSFLDLGSYSLSLGLNESSSTGTPDKGVEISSTTFTVYDNINNKGVEYPSDYSANWTDHSLVTKKWVTDNFSGGSQNLQQVTTEGNSTTNGIVVNPGSLINPSLPNGTSISANNQFFRINRAKGTNTGNTDSEMELSNSYARLTSYDTGHSYTTNLVLNGNNHVIELTTETSDGDPEEPQVITTGFIIDGANEAIQATHPITGVSATQPDHLVTKSQLDAAVVGGGGVVMDSRSLPFAGTNGLVRTIFTSTLLDLYLTRTSGSLLLYLEYKGDATNQLFFRVSSTEDNGIPINNSSHNNDVENVQLYDFGNAEDHGVYDITLNITAEDDALNNIEALVSIKAYQVNDANSDDDELFYMATIQYKD